eukprot:3187403-Rhodomonas_salina.1
MPLDACSGQTDASGVYAYRRNPSCLSLDEPGQHSALVGFMLDGVPVYGPRDVGGADADELEGARGLDECGGHVDAEHPFYHYHFRTRYPHAVTCLRGCVNASAVAGLNERLSLSAQACVPAPRQFDYTQLWNVAWIERGGAQRGKVTDARRGRTVWSGLRALALGKLYDLRLEYKH